MTIPGRGDLAPPHRHLHVGRYVTVALVLALLAGGGYAAYQGLTGGSSPNRARPLPLCAKHAAAPSTPAFPQSKVTVYNASLITGLATSVANELKHRGLPVGRVGNAAKVGKGIATIRYSADRKLEATKLDAQVKGAKMVQIAGTHLVELDINPKFTTLVSAGAAKAAFRAAVTAQHLVSATPTPSPTCRSRS